MIIQVITSLLNCTHNPQSVEEPAGNKFSDDTIAIKDLPWPIVSPPGPTCTQPTTFTMPDLPVANGEIIISASADLQPTGTIEKLLIEIKHEYIASIDTLSDTSVQIITDSTTLLIKSTLLKSGKAAAWVKFTTPGIHTITARIIHSDDTLSGAVSVMAFIPSIPIAEMEISDNDMETILKNPYEKILVPAAFLYNGIRYGASVRIHGGSSRDYPKKSFRFDLSNGLTLPDNHNHIILRAEWNDKTMMRNYIAMETARYGTWLPVPQTEPVHFRVNQRYYGVMWKVERIDADFLRARALDRAAYNLYEADPDIACFVPGADLSPRASIDDYRCAYKLQKGTQDYTDLISLIQTTLQLPEEQFADVINDSLRVNDLLIYFALMAVIQNQDHIKKNYYLYHTTSSADNRWTIFPWDCELTFGHLWTEQYDVLDESIFTDSPLEFGALTPPFNTLFVRLYNIPAYRQRFNEMVLHLVNTVFTETFVNNCIDRILCKASPDILADKNKRATNGEYLQRVDEIRQFVKSRRVWIQSQLQ